MGDFTSNSVTEITRDDATSRIQADSFGGPWGVAVDGRGNVWVANNWSKLTPITGGNGLVEFIGLAAPVRTPLIGPPQRP